MFLSEQRGDAGEVVVSFSTDVQPIVDSAASCSGPVDLVAVEN